MTLAVDIAQYIFERYLFVSGEKNWMR